VCSRAHKTTAGKVLANYIWSCRSRKLEKLRSTGSISHDRYNHNARSLDALLVSYHVHISEDRHWRYSPLIYDVPQQHPSREFLKDDDLDYKSTFFCKMCIAVEDDSIPFFMSSRCSYPFPHMVISLLEFHNNEKWHHILRYTGQHFSWLARVSRMKVSSAVWSTG